MVEGDEFDRYVRARVPALRRTAFLLSGDWDRADEVVQLALIRLFTKWRRVQAADNPDAYLRAILVRCWIDEQRRPWRRRERLVDYPVASALRAPPADLGLASRDELMQVLRRMPPRQRACVVLRYWEDRSVEETAQLLTCSPSTVRSQTSRALRTLRALLDPAVHTQQEERW